MSNLEVQNIAYKLAIKVYKLTFNIKLKKDFTIVDQIRRSSVSTVLNIVEGQGTTAKMFRNYLRISIGSANETRITLMLIRDLYKIDTMELSEEYVTLAKKLTRLKKSLS